MDQILTRFELLFPKLVKQQFREKCAIQALSKSDHSSKTKKLMKESQMSNGDELRLITSLAKTEVASAINLDALKTELLSQVAKMQVEERYEPVDLFTIVLLLQSSKSNHGELLNLFEYAISSFTKLIESSLNAEEVVFECLIDVNSVNQRLTLIEYIIKTIVKHGDHELAQRALRILFETEMEQILKTEEDVLQQITERQLTFISLKLHIIQKMFEMQKFAKLIENQNTHFIEDLSMVFECSQKLLKVFAAKSRFYIFNKASNWKKQGLAEKENRRATSLFAEVQQLVLDFTCSFLKNFEWLIKPQMILNLFEILFVDSELNEDG
jgi:hypothetical protein